MRHFSQTKAAPMKRLACLLLSSWIAAPFAASQSPTVYQSCLALAYQAPEQALQLADDPFSGLTEPESLHCQAEARLTGGDFRAAAQLFEQVPLQMPLDAAEDQAFLWSQAAFAWEQAGDQTRALVALDRLIASLPEYEGGYTYRAALLGRMNDYQTAIETLKLGLQIIPNSGLIQVFLATAYRRDGQLERAAETLEAARLAGSTPPDLYILEYGLIEVSRGNFQSAKEAFSLLIANHPQSDAAQSAARYLQQL